jgi:uncharacterized repeat protein (TIGR02543 family)
VYVYDPQQPAAGWLSVSNLPATRRSLAAAWINGKLYAIGGYNGSYQSSVYVYDPQQPTAGWLSVSNLPAASAFEGAAIVNGTLYAVGGYNTSSSYQNTVYVYDPQQPAAGWLSVSNLPATRRGLGVTSINGALYAAGGYNGTYQSTVYQGSFGAGVVPASGSRLGGTTVTLTGNYLGSGDVTNVTLCGVPAVILTDNSPTQLVISTAASVIPTNGDVVVYSTSYGVTTRSNAFTYLEAYATLSVQASPANAGSVSGGGTFVVGSKVQLAATASNNWLFTGWNDGATNNPYSVTAPPTNRTYTANFSKIDSIGDGIPDWWRAQYFGGDGTTTNALSCATADPDGDGLTNLQEFLAGTNPNDPSSSMCMLPAPAAAQTNSAFVVQWQSVAGKFYALECSTNLVNGFDVTLKTHIPATPPINSETDSNAVGPGPWFYRVRLE